MAKKEAIKVEKPMVLALGMPEHIPNTQGREIAGTAECKYRSALGVDESRLEFWLPHLSGLYNDEVPSTIEGNCSRANFPASQCGVGPGKRANRTRAGGRAGRPTGFKGGF